MYPVYPPLSLTHTANSLVFVHGHMSVSLVFKMSVQLHACLHVKHIVACFLKIKCETVRALSFWDETAVYRTESHPPMVFDLEQKEQREKREAGTQFEPHGHLSAGGPHACTRADNKKRKERRDLRRGGGDKDSKRQKKRCSWRERAMCGDSGVPQTSEAILLIIWSLRLRPFQSDHWTQEREKKRMVVKG